MKSVKKKSFKNPFWDYSYVLSISKELIQKTRIGKCLVEIAVTRRIPAEKEEMKIEQIKAEILPFVIVVVEAFGDRQQSFSVDTRILGLAEREYGNLKNI